MRQFFIGDLSHIIHFKKFYLFIKLINYYLLIYVIYIYILGKQDKNTDEEKGFCSIGSPVQKCFILYLDLYLQSNESLF